MKSYPIAKYILLAALLVFGFVTVRHFRKSPTSVTAQKTQPASEKETQPESSKGPPSPPAITNVSASSSTNASPQAATNAAPQMAKAPDQTMAIAVMGLDLPTVAAEKAKARSGALTALAQSLGIKLPSKGVKTWAPDWSQPHAETYGSAKYALWQNMDAKYGDKTGVFLVFTTTDSTGKEIFGIAFCPSDDKSTSTITKSLETFGPGSYQ